MHVIFLARSFPSVLTSEIPVEVLIILIKELLNLNVNNGLVLIQGIFAKAPSNPFLSPIYLRERWRRRSQSISENDKQHFYKLQQLS
jgi:hypothetical protein